MGRALKREALNAAQDVDHPMSGSDPSTTCEGILYLYFPPFCVSFTSSQRSIIVLLSHFSPSYCHSSFPLHNLQ